MAQAGKRRKTRRGGKKHRAARLANGGIVRGSPEWYRMQGIRPQAGDKGPAPKPVEGQYGKDKEQPKSNVVSKFGAAGRKKAQRDANEGYPTGGR